MPIVPVFGGGGGSTPSPPTQPEWLNVPTQTEWMDNNATAVYTFTLNTPTNGTPPYTYRVIGGNPVNTGDSGFKLTGNTLELVRQNTQTGAAGTSPTSQPFRVLVWDSAGNFGIGILLLRAPSLVDPPPMQIVEEKVLDWDENQEGWNFASYTPPSGWTSGEAGYAQGDCFTYPRPTSGLLAQGVNRANCAPGSCAILSWPITGPSGEIILLLRVLRRKVDLSNPGWSWASAPDFMDWDNLSSYAPTVPLGTTSTLATVTETIASIGKSYNFERVAYAVTAGAVPTLEVATVGSGVAVLESQNILSSARVVAMVLRPSINGTLQTYRMSSGSSSLAVLLRMRSKITLTGDSPVVEIKIGAGFSTAPVGMRMEGVIGTFFGADPIVRISALRNSIYKLGGFRRSVWGSGSEIGIDFLMTGGATWLALYPWDPSWTDYPEWNDESNTLDVPQVIGPVQIVGFSMQPANSNVAPYPVAGPPVAQPNTQANITNDMGIIPSISLNSRAGNGARVEISDVRYYWKMLNLGVVQ